MAIKIKRVGTSIIIKDTKGDALGDSSPKANLLYEIIQQNNKIIKLLETAEERERHIGGSC